MDRVLLWICEHLFEGQRAMITTAIVLMLAVLVPVVARFTFDASGIVTFVFAVAGVACVLAAVFLSIVSNH
jgi:hypothetical protein